MEDDFSQSLTPPVSPFMVEELCEPAPAWPPCFSCAFEPGREESCSLSSEGYIGRGTLKRLLLKLDPAPADFEADTVDIFGFPWVTETALVESPKLLFGLFRQKVFSLEAMVQSSSQGFGHASSLHYEAEELRHQCTLFLTYVKVFIHRFLEAPLALEEGLAHPFARLEAQLPSTLVEELFSITLLMGRLRDLPANVQSTFTIQHPGKLLPPSWHLLHLYLDVHWVVLEILQLLGQKLMGQVVYAHQFVDLTGETLTNISLFEDHLNNLLSDLISLSMSKYGKVRATEALSTNHYHCVCTKELWILLIHLLEHRSKTIHTQSFWAYVNTLLQSVLKGVQVGGRDLRLPAHCKDVLGFAWWLLTHLAQLGMYSCNGTLHNEKQLEDNWSFVSELLKSSCDVKAGVQEDQIRMHVHCCLSLSLMWESNVSVVTTLWEYFSKNLSGSFSVPWLGMSGLANVSPSPLILLEQAKSCSSPAPLTSTSHAQLYLSANSFLIFLRMLALHLSHESAPGAPWRQIKGRIYAKFHARRMAELSESGLHHFLLLFLVLACCADLEDVAGRACDLLALLPPGATAPTICALQWRGQLSLTLLYVERALDVGALATRLSSSFEKAAREFYLKTTEVARRAALWPLLASYLGGVSEVWETSATLCLSEEKLLGEGFSLLLPACRPAELSTALSFLQTALAQLRRVQRLCHQHGCPADSSSWAPPPSVAKERHLAVATALWTHFFPFLRSLRLSQTPPAQLADAGAGFTLLALDMPSSTPQDLQPHPVQSIMQGFGWDEMLCPLLVTRYLNHLLQNGELVGWMSSGSGAGSAQALCVRAWIRSVLQQHLHKSPDAPSSRTGRTLDEQLAEMTRLVLRLPEVESLLQRAGLQPGSARLEAKPALALFIKSVGRVYSGMQALSERSSLVCRALEYVGDILKYLKPYLLNRSTEGLQLAYWALGCMVKLWSPLLATAKALPLLLRIVDVLLLPHSLLQQDKSPPTQVLSALRDTLPLYLQGLSVAAGMSQTQGAYLKQQLRNVITQYLSRFLPATPSAGAVANHPVLLAGCESVPSPQGARLRRNILEVLRENFLQFKGHAPPPRLAAVLSFLLELLRRNNDTDPTLLTVPLPSVLRCLMLINEPQVKRLSADCLQLIVERCSSAATQGPCEHTLAILRTFVEENEGVYDLQVYTVLETVAILSPSTVVSLIPVLSRSLRNTEQKRGLGRNTLLRNGYRAVLALLGEAGQTEMVDLED
ncbi:protein MMS22-like [Electrophorus electricus]|uniref:Protein MMS22-like n=1 Tax=Electrophorus electricus TaxID=8005 RepID=A0A4W4F809_ELEEL|nr:protein MMS22-like [Electrophorus electricus]XP_026868331.2 protein MMS22-like [Electrophorus electricus]XP_026868332.2 protein MMS22-like [Electrophorus electricus]XP_035384213.1 protein MMS22-like [Electrophorus electricus]